MSGTYQVHNSSLSIISHRANIALAAMMVSALSAGFAQEAQAQSYTETVLYSFSGGSDGGLPNGVALDSQGNLYGVAQYGGYKACGPRAYQSCGTVFKLDTAEHLTVIHDFTGSRGDGINPLAGVILDGQGNLYGTTVAGGNLSCTLPSPWGGQVNGCGMVYKLDPSGHETVLHSFTGLSGGGDGAGPYAAVVEDGAGNLYGTTYWGGNGSSLCTSNGQQGCGTVFKVDPSGHETVLYRFTGANGDGESPEAALVLDAQGNLYGTTSFGGSYGFGTVFKVDPSGHETVLHSFRGVNEGMMNGDGAYPVRALVFDGQGNLYGTTIPQPEAPQPMDGFLRRARRADGMHFESARVKGFGDALDVPPLTRRVAAFVGHGDGKPLFDTLALQLQQLELILLQQLFVFVLRF